MAAFAQILKVNLPYSEYWLPLAIGIGVAICALTITKLVMPRKKEAVPPPVQQPPAPEHDPFTQGSANEMRKSYRRQGNMTEVNVALDEKKDRPVRAWVLDRSMGGLCLQSSMEIPAGTRVHVLPVNATSMTPWIEIEVRSCRSVQDGFELGCQFVKTPSWSILLLFG
jgi:hypothetical protein